MEPPCQSNRSVTQIARNIEEHVMTLEQSQSISESIELCEMLMVEYDSLQKVSPIKDTALLTNIHETGIKLWNIIITKKTGKKINKLSVSQGRHVAFHLTYLVALNEQSQTGARKQQAMAMKCGKDWLDNGKVVLAENCFVLSTECYIKLQGLLENDNVRNHTTPEQIQESHSNMIQVYLYRADLALQQSQHATAIDLMNKAKHIVVKHKLMIKYFCLSCYNFGLDCYQKELFQHSRDFLQISLEDIDRSEIEKDSEILTKQLLAMVYMELKGAENYEKALNVIDQFLLDQSTPKSIHMKIKVLLLLQYEDDAILQAFNELSAHNSLDINLSLQTVGLFAVSKRFLLCHKALELLDQKYTNTQENIQIQLKKLEILLSNSEVGEAKNVLKEEQIRVHNHGNIFDKSSLQQLHLLLWEQAAKEFEKKQYEEALYWYDSSFLFMKQCTDDSLNLSKLQRNRAACLMELTRLEQALEAAEHAQLYDQDSIQVYFLLYKISLALMKEDQAIQAMKKLSELKGNCDKETLRNLVSLAAQLAFESGNKKIAEVVLEILVELKASGSKHSLIPIRCLARLKFSQLNEDCERDEIVCILKLVDKAWNLALCCSNYYVEMEKSFLLCYEFSQLLSENLRKIQQQRTCLLMAVGCNLQIVRQENDQREERLNKALSLIQKCYELSKELTDKGCTDQKNKQIATFLMSYEFETKAQLGMTHDLDNLLERSLELENGKIKTLENFASVALSSCKEVVVFGIKALKLAIKCYLEQENLNLESMSKAIHSLISVAMNCGNATNAESKEEAYEYFQDALRVIENIQEGYPEMELVWLMTKAWNCGIHLYSAQHFDAAEKWCQLSMKFLKFLNQLKENYEPHMSGVFTDIISRIQQSRVQMQVEE